MIESIAGYATISGAAKILNSSYWACWELVKRRNISTFKLYGSQSRLVRIADLAEAIKQPASK